MSTGNGLVVRGASVLAVLVLVGCSSDEPIDLTCVENGSSQTRLVINPDVPSWVFGDPKVKYLQHDWCGNSGDSSIRIDCEIKVTDTSLEIDSPPHVYIGKDFELPFVRRKVTLNRVTGEGLMLQQGKVVSRYSNCTEDKLSSGDQNRSGTP